ncbi:MAG TPA: Flp pilus assembly protein CpaB [Bryobacteraceae bacterium]|jgi:Flp pilus assembly protein CpaB|nr:Flp pilus assembly protein CpaB [Bryobacteraceae bacterium]
MKRNMVPLLGIAFVVAIISTGVFYGLFAGKLRSSSDLPGHAVVVAARDMDRGTVIQASDLRVSEMQGVLGGAFSKPEEAAGTTLLTAMKANEPLLQERVAPRASDTTGPGGLVPTGMRAVSMHIFQSESLLSLLRAGSRVDLQAVSERSGAAELRTVLENVQVLGVSAPDNGNRAAGSVVTVLIRAQDADMVALADAASKIRVSLRNPLDDATTPRHSLGLAAVFSSNGKLEADEPGSSRPSSAVAWDHPVELHIRVLSVSDAAVEDLRAKSTEVASNNSWRVAAFHSIEEARNLVRGMQEKHQLEVVSRERLLAGVGRPASYHAGAKPDNLRVQFSPGWLAGNKFTLAVKPQMGGSSGPQTELADKSSFLIESSAPENSPARLFPSHSWEHRHLIIFVFTRDVDQTSPVAVARTDRGR